jgi:photosynthesis system II assembly factor YCF48-like protein
MRGLGLFRSDRSLRRLAAFAVLLSIPQTLLMRNSASPVEASSPHWVLQRSNTAADLYDISCSSASECVAIGGATMLRTVNGGKTWRRVAVPYTRVDPIVGDLRAIRCPAPGVCSMVAGKDLVLRTSNGGQTWQTRHVSLSPQLAGLNHLACPTRLVCFATASPSGPSGTWFNHSAAVFKTGDTGRTWRRLSIPPSVICPGDCGSTHPTVGYDLQWISCQNAASCRAGGDTFIGSHEGYAGAVIRTDDGGRSWQLVHQGFDPNIATCPTRLVCTGVFYLPNSPNQTPALERSVDGGKTWTNRRVRVAVAAIACTGSTFCELAGPHGALAMSIDARLFTQASPAAGDLNSVACPRMGACYAVGTNGTILARKR